MYLSPRVPNRPGQPVDTTTLTRCRGYCQGVQASGTGRRRVGNCRRGRGRLGRGRGGDLGRCRCPDRRGGAAGGGGGCRSRRRRCARGRRPRRRGPGGARACRRRSRGGWPGRCCGRCWGRSLGRGGCLPRLRGRRGRRCWQRRQRTRAGNGGCRAKHDGGGRRTTQGSHRATGESACRSRSGAGSRISVAEPVSQHLWRLAGLPVEHPVGPGEHHENGETRNEEDDRPRDETPDDNAVTDGEARLLRAPGGETLRDLFGELARARVVSTAGLGQRGSLSFPPPRHAEVKTAEHPCQRSKNRNRGRYRPLSLPSR